MRACYPAPFERVRQRGAVAVIVAILLLSLVVTLVMMSVEMSGSGGYDTAAQNDAVEALFLAESALERAGKRFNATPTTVCNAASLEVGTDFSLPRGTFRVVQVFTTKFDGTAFPSANWCRVQTRGVITATGVTRIIEGIIERSTGNLLPPSANADFNAPTGLCRQDLGCSVTSWTLNAVVPAGENTFQPWDDCSPKPPPAGTTPLPWPGLPATNNTPCSVSNIWDRAAFTRKDWNGNTAATAAGNFTFSPPITLTTSLASPVSLVISFDYFFNCFVGSNCNSGKDMEVVFRLKSSTETWTSANFNEGNNKEVWMIGGAPGGGLVTVSIPAGTGTSDTKVINSLEIDFSLKAGQKKMAWLDNIFIKPSGTTSATTVNLRQWREIVQ